MLILFTSILSLLLIYLYIYIFLNKRIFSFVGMFLIFFFICYYAGYPLIFFVYHLKGDFRGIPFDHWNVVAFYPFIFLLLFLFFSLPFSRFYSKKDFIHNFKCEKKTFFKILMILSFMLYIISVAMYVAKNGGFVLLKAQDYTERFEKNAGMGFLSVFFQLYIPFIILYFLMNPTKRRLLTTFLLSLALGILNYMAIGGMRNIFLSGILSLIALSFNKKLLKLRTIILISIIGFTFVTLLAVFRYWSFFETLKSEDILYYLTIYTIDSFSPVYSLHEIIEKVPKVVDYISISYFHNYFLAFIPRFIWPDKPLLMKTSAWFFTNHILQYSREVIISPTFVGEMYMMFGIWGILIGAVILALILNILDIILYKPFCKNLLLYYSLLPLTFWIGRGILETFIYRLLLFLLVFYFVFFITSIITSIKKGVKYENSSPDQQISN